MNAVAKLAAAPEPAPNRLAMLRDPFPDHQISKLPKQSKAQKEALEKDRTLGVNCQVCGGWHHKHAVHLDYVGHAALTDRLLDTDLDWDWEPLGHTPEGLPALDRNGGLWIRLTVCGKSRLGYGSADGKQGGDAMKEIIGDALRNAAMRFGAALDLWHKGVLHLDDAGADEPEAPRPRQSAADLAINLLRGCSADAGLFKEAWAKNFEGWKKVMDPADYVRVQAVKAELVKKFVAEAEAAKPTPAHTMAQDGADPFDDPIPF